MKAAFVAAFFLVTLSTHCHSDDEDSEEEESAVGSRYCGGMRKTDSSRDSE
jgi:hypothetical protein